MLLSQSVSHVCALTGLEWRVFKSSCLPKKFRDEWSFGGLTYRVSGDPDGKKPVYLKYNQCGVKEIHKLFYVEVNILKHALEFYCDRIFIYFLQITNFLYFL